MAEEIDLVEELIDTAQTKLTQSTASSEQRMNQIQESQAMALIAQAFVLARIEKHLAKLVEYEGMDTPK